jgi:diguanylate cyclase (GGDEF)-like protein/PAS domain S-box-containing protein
MLNLLPSSTFLFLLAAIGWLGMAIYVLIVRRHDWLTVTREAMLNSISDCIVVVDGNDRIVDINPAAEDLIGRSAIQVRGKPLVQCLPELKSIEHSIVNGIHEVTLNRENQSLTFDLRASPIYDPHGRLQSRVIALRDITERKRAEAALRASEAQSRYILDGTQAWLVTVDTRGKFTFMNSALANALGYTVEEMLGQLYLRFVHPADRKRVSQFYLDQIKRGEKSNTLEYRIITKSGETRWVRFISNLNSVGGKIVGQTGVALDITEQKRTEEQLRLQSEIAVNLSEGVCLIRAADSIIVYCNARFEEMFGYGAGELIGKHVSILNAPDGQDPAKISQMIREGIQQHNRWSGEIYNVRKDGARFWTSASLSQFEHTEFGLVQVAVQQDITERKRAEQALHESHDRLLAILDSIDADIYVADFKTNEILFVNRHMQASFGGNLVGKVCWQVFHHRATPCPGCINPKLVDAEGNPTGMYIWEGQNPNTQRWYTKYDRVIQWIDGRLVRLEIATDITDRKRAEEQTALKNKQLTMLNQLGQSLNKLGTPTEIVERTSDLIGQVLDNRNLYIALYDPATNYVSFPIYWMDGEKHSIAGRLLGRGLTEAVIRSRAPILINDHVREALAERGIELIGRECCCYLGVPIIADDQVIGVIAVQDYTQPNVYDAGHVELLSTIASQAAIALTNARLYAAVQQELNERKRAEEQLVHNAFHDPLTDLPNRALFMDRLGRAIERAKRHPTDLFAVLFLDLDRFKVVNDSLGHSVGDRLLIESAKRLTKCIRTADTVARLGGDEFVILLNEIENDADALVIADRIQRALAAPFDFDQHHIFISVSIGIVPSTLHYESAEDILRDADIAMYRAKTCGRGRFEVFDPTMRDRAMTRLELETDLRQALVRHELAVYYQPIVSLMTNRVTGFEALVRWHHPTRGIVPPAEFIPMAEETGLIIPIGQWVLREACRQMRAWQIQFPHEPPLTISVNLSPKQFARADLIEQIMTALRETGLAAACLNLELTESLIIEDSQAVAGILDQLRALGVQVQIDDFGTGYSSLGYLHRLPIDTLKIDRTFIGKMGMNGSGSEIVRTILTLAHDLGMQVIAEGVETAAQVTKLKGMACEYGQGYYFTKPVDSATASRLIAQLAGGAMQCSI